ncbi:protein DOG1-like 4 [Diospyros lotus]|uniref:protein DOG1-like 4 n=1 Tax=Diospyros lotus TaxID=55363 RepID=UPI0022568048|nr:protein DOG1-like 4 [Diospyros lotus]
MSFHGFYQTWFDHLRRMVDQLAEARRPPATQEDHHALRQLVHKVMTHYAEYYRVKSLAAKHDVVSVFAEPWCTALERSLHWIGGWRPTTAFHLVYTESSILFESHVIDILRGLRTGDLGDLSPAQFRRVSELQCDTVREENSITDELSDWQDCSSDLLGVCTNVDGKIERLVRILEKADDLRLRTVRKVVDLLTPQQGVEFLVAAAEFHFGVRSWGLNHDRLRRKV